MSGRGGSGAVGTVTLDSGETTTWTGQSSTSTAVWTNYTNESTFTTITITGNNTGTPWFVAIEIEGVGVLTTAGILPSAQATFPNGLWWIKDRANSNQHQLVDSVRGSNLAFTNPAKGPESTYAAPTGDCVAWCWGTDNTGTNADAGFQILTWDGTGSARTISHDLDQSRPLDMILVKMHSAAAGNTYVNNCLLYTSPSPRDS